MGDSFDFEKEVSDSKDGTKQATFDDIDKHIKITHKKKKFVCEEL